MREAPTHPATGRRIAVKIPHYLNAINVSESCSPCLSGTSAWYWLPIIRAVPGGRAGIPFIWITLAFLGVRTLGMSANRIINAGEDAKNPRTSSRHIPTGLLKPIEVGGMAAVGAVIFFAAAWQLNTLALILSPVAAAYVVIYSFAKYYTWLCSLMLGFALAIAPSGAWIV